MSKENLAAEIKADFEARREARREIEAKWNLNLRFMLGKQNSLIDPRGEIVEENFAHGYEVREVYNHIAPLIETRLAKFTRVNCAVNVRPAGADDSDVNAARLSGKITYTALADNGFTALAAEANYWAELTGTSFFKVVWDADSGEDGGVRIAVCPPQEIFPDDMSAADVNACRSVIHAKVYPVETVYELWGAEVESEDVDIYDYEGYSKRVLKEKQVSRERSGYALVLERYEAPSKRYPEGRLSIVAGDKVLYDGELPYMNGAGGKRVFPFVRQTSLSVPASFYGMSIIERLIPVQRAYNAVKNRKHEFMARLASGVYAVEDGSIDVESLEEDGLYPGRVVVYRQGGSPPVPMSAGSVPAEFRDEEDRLLNEFRNISGVSNVINVSGTELNTVSGYALSLLLEQEYSRMSVTTESIRTAVKEVARQILRLYRQFADKKRLMTIGGASGEVEVISFIGSDLGGDDVVTETDSEMVESPATRKNMVLELMRYGLLSDENGRISNRNRSKIIEMLGFGNWEAAKSADEVHIRKAEREDLGFTRGEKADVCELDDHSLHIDEHKAFAAGAFVAPAARKLVEEHVRKHKIMLRLEYEAASVSTANAAETTDKNLQ